MDKNTPSQLCFICGTCKRVANDTIVVDGHTLRCCGFHAMKFREGRLNQEQLDKITKEVRDASKSP